MCRKGQERDTETTHTNTHKQRETHSNTHKHKRKHKTHNTIHTKQVAICITHTSHATPSLTASFLCVVVSRCLIFLLMLPLMLLLPLPVNSNARLTRVRLAPSAPSPCPPATLCVLVRHVPLPLAVKTRVAPNGAREPHPAVTWWIVQRHALPSTPLPYLHCTPHSA